MAGRNLEAVAVPVAMSDPPPAPSPRQAPEETATVTGTLVDAESRRPISGATVRWSLDGGRQTTDGSGKFKFERAPVVHRFGIFAIKEDAYLPEVIDVAIPAGAKSHDLGNVRLVRGNGKTPGERAKGEAGIVHELRDGKTFIKRVRPASAAEQAGLGAGTRIVSIDGESADGLGYTTRSRLLDGDVGSPVTLIVEAPDGKRRTHTLVRRPPWAAEHPSGDR
jgi:hypothetical protein